MITLKDIKHNSFAGDRDYFKAMQEFLGAFKWDVDEIIGSHSLMYKEGTDLSAWDKKTLDKELAERYWSKYLFRATFKVDGLLKEFFWQEDSYILLPKIINSKNVEKINPDTILKVFIKELVKWWYLNDKFYLTIAPILRAFPLGYNSKTKKIWFLEEEIRTSSKHAYKLGMNGTSQWKLSVTWDISLEDLLAKELELGWRNTMIWDPHRDFAYTHSLRAVAWYNIFPWSRKVIMDWNKINVVAASKWSGKSYFAAELCAAELFKEKGWFGWRKIRKIKYFVPDLNTVWSDVMDYMEWFLIEFTRKKVNWEPIIKINKSKYEIVCTITNTVFKMVSLHWYKEGNSVGEWLACDFWVIDEAAYVADWFWKMFSQRALMESEALLVITTISENTPRDHWFYKLLIDGELWSELISSHRVDILKKRNLYELDYKSQHEIKTDEDLLKMNKKIDDIMDLTLEDLRASGTKEFYARAFCVILDERNVFNIVGSVVPHIAMQANLNDYYILWIDFWGNTDPAWVVLINLTKWITTKIQQLKWVPYLEQLEVAKELKKILKNLTVIWDATTIGKVIMQEDQKKDCVVDYWVQFTWSGDWKWNEKWFYVSSKEHMVRQTALMIDKWVLQLSSEHQELITQMKNFVKITGTKSTVAKYQGKWSSHDDLVDALMMCVFWATTIMWLTTREEWADYWVEFDNLEADVYNETNYYESDWQYNNSWNVY